MLPYVVESSHCHLEVHGCTMGEQPRRNVEMAKSRCKVQRNPLVLIKGIHVSVALYEELGNLDVSLLEQRRMQRSSMSTSPGAYVPWIFDSAAVIPENHGLRLNVRNTDDLQNLPGNVVGDRIKLVVYNFSRVQVDNANSGWLAPCRRLSCRKKVRFQ